jgi:LuxR family maltose regulon positive regulatory protein
LETKLHTPTPGPSTLTRPHLLAALSAGAGKKLTLVRAPAGFGKTTLMASWCAAERRRRPAGWVHLDQGDNDPLCLLTYMVEALHRIDPAVGSHSLAALRAPGVSLLDAVIAWRSRAVLTILQKGGILHDAHSGKYNIVAAEELSNLLVAQQIAEVLGKPLRHELVENPPNRPKPDMRYALSGRKLEALGWSPEVPFEVGLRSALAV